MFPVDFPDEIVINRCADAWATKQSYRNVKGRVHFQSASRSRRSRLERIDDIILIRHLAISASASRALPVICNLDRPADRCSCAFPLAKSPADSALPGAVFASKEDADYRDPGADRGGPRGECTRRALDMPGHRRYHIRQMQLFRSPQDLAADAPIDPYQTDQAYWQSIQFAPHPQ